MKNLLMILFTLSTLTGFSQLRTYIGSVGDEPVRLFTYSYPDGDTRAVLAYDKEDTPITIDGRISHFFLVLTEKSFRGDTMAVLKFRDYDPNDNHLHGRWINQKDQSELPVDLTKLHDFDSYDYTSIDKVEVLQKAFARDHYFNVLLSKNESEAIRVTGVRIYEKRTDRLIGELAMDCPFQGLNSISIGDYNFDGIDDFSVFESSYTGPNTSRIYVLRDPESANYFVSEISGISLEFDPEARLIYEHEQYSGGRKLKISTYKLIDNRMQLIGQECLEYSEEMGDFTETECN